MFLCIVSISKKINLTNCCVFMMLLIGNSIWSNEAVELLVQLYKAKQSLFNGTESHVRHDLLYRDMAESMTQFGYNYTGKQCKNKFCDLKSRFMQEYDMARKTGAAPSMWEWYGVMEGLFQGTATLEPPFLFSSGTGYDVRGRPSTSRELIPGTRTRKSSDYEPVKEHHHGKAKDGAKKPVFKSRMLEMQERQMDQREEFIGEMRLMRQTYDTTSAEQLHLLRMLIEKRNS